jgi:hypothetical protein
LEESTGVKAPARLNTDPLDLLKGDLLKRGEKTKKSEVLPTFIREFSLFSPHAMFERERNPKL